LSKVLKYLKKYWYFAALTPLEASVFRLYVQGKSYADIARTLGVGQKSVDNAVRRMKAEGVTHIVECGPGRVLAGLIRRIEPSIETANISSTASIAELLAKDGFHA